LIAFTLLWLDCESGMAGGPCEVPPAEDMVKDSIPKIPSNNIGSYPR